MVCQIIAAYSTVVYIERLTLLWYARSLRQTVMLYIERLTLLWYVRSLRQTVMLYIERV